MTDLNERMCKAISSIHTVMYYEDRMWKPRADGLLFFELYTLTGYSRGNPQRIDAYHVNDVPSRNYTRTAYEIKVTRRDFMGELAQPNKRRAALMFSNLFYFVTPAGLVDRVVVPVECGLIEVDERGKRVVQVKAPWRDTSPPTWALAVSMARHVERRKG